MNVSAQIPGTPKTSVFYSKQISLQTGNIIPLISNVASHPVSKDHQIDRVSDSHGAF